jgi:hypothetical protein
MMKKRGRRLAGRVAEKADQANVTLLDVPSDQVVLQPPLPEQEFWPLQPLSPDLQPPWFLQEFLPLQSCFPASLEDESPLPVLPSANAREAIDPA